MRHVSVVETTSEELKCHERSYGKEGGNDLQLSESKQEKCFRGLFFSHKLQLFRKWTKKNRCLESEFSHKNLISFLFFFATHRILPNPYLFRIAFLTYSQHNTLNWWEWKSMKVVTLKSTTWGHFNKNFFDS